MNLIFHKVLDIYIILNLILLIGACRAMERNKPSHHTKKGFRNLDLNVEAKGLGDVLKWQVSKRFQSDLPSLNPEDYKFEIQSNDGKSLRDNKDNFTVTWIGHASTLVQLDGKNVLTDPIWSNRCSPVTFAGPERYTPPGIQIKDLPPIHIVIISHNHYDHMDLPSLKELEKMFQPVFFVGLGNAKFLKSEGLQKVHEMDWWESVELNDLQIHFTPTQHFSARGVFDRDETLWGSYVVQGKKQSFYFAGDTGYFSGFKEIGKKFPNLDLAILPIGAYEPRWFMKAVHMNPEDSVQAFLDLGAKYLLPMHYQTFILTDEALDAPLPFTVSEFEKKKIDLIRLLPLKIGESKFF